ncbi:M48 family metallopeptidase [Actinoplanes couchii]|uniref:Peptidase M48 domain-containing protein n=1 Tax=Actinoplanes couchii TaxID=403638 RepID=A0ABQ3XB21_9ACTN|nr:M48 family metallopeptidase [Actinoplanes couchii]MDR6323193.1 Zn-dependent protease with chaperone function [Actinoplanes couchii]GID55708.1 hypothetical protein Aco03nite_041120 [Actinoplanes couchii]
MSKGAPSAARSVIALAGFLAVVGLQLTVVLLVLWVVLQALPGALAIRIGVPLSLATFGALGYATWRALHARHRVPAGVAVSRDQAPHLWNLVDAASAAAGVPAPVGLTVVADATAAVGERTRMLGIIGGRRDLYLGLPLLQALEPDRLRAIVTHELAHGSRALSRWAPLAYRGRVAVGRIVPRIRRRNLAGAALRAYAGFYRRIDAPFSREQEFAADRIAATHAGAAATLAALRDLPALAGMQRLFHAEYVGPGWQAGYVPDDVFGGLLRVLAARTTEMTMLRARDPEPSGPWDTHPPMPERIAALTPLATAESTPAAPASATPTPTSPGASAPHATTPGIAPHATTPGIAPHATTPGVAAHAAAPGGAAGPGVGTAAGGAEPSAGSGVPSAGSAAPSAGGGGAEAAATDPTGIFMGHARTATGRVVAAGGAGAAAGSDFGFGAASGTGSASSFGTGSSAGAAEGSPSFDGFAIPSSGRSTSSSSMSDNLAPGVPSSFSLTDETEASSVDNPVSASGAAPSNEQGMPGATAASSVNAQVGPGGLGAVSASEGAVSVSQGALPVDNEPLPAGPAAAEGAGAGNGAGAGVGEAVELVPDLPGLGRALQDVAFPPRGRSVVSWDQCLSVARTSEMEREGEAALAAISRSLGETVPDAGHLLTLAADGRLRAVAAAVFPDAPPEEAASRVVELLALMLALAALRSGVARWRHSWTGAAEVVAVDGGYLDLAELASAAADPETTEAVRAYLIEAGVDLTAAAADPGSARAQVLGGLVNLSADGERTDVLITDLGLLLVPGLPRNRGHEAKRRLTRIAADGVPAGAVLPARAPAGSTGRHAARPAADDGKGKDSEAEPPASASEDEAGLGSSAAESAPSVGAVGASGGASGFPAGTVVGASGTSAGTAGASGDASGSSTGASGGFPSGRAEASSDTPGSFFSDAGGAEAAGGSAPASSGAASTVASVLPGGGRFVPFGDVSGVTALPGMRKGWVLGLRGGGNLTLRPALDADELPGGWAAWDETVNFLAGTR